MYRSVNPATGMVSQTYSTLSAEEVGERLELAHNAFRSHRLATPELRASWLTAIAAGLDEQNEPLARLITQEMGKPITAARAEVAKCAACARYYAALGPQLLEPRRADPAAVGARRAEIRLDPLGVILAVMPWNFPVWQVIRFLAPALMVGNAGLLKPASSVPGTSLLLDRIVAEAGVPAGMFQSLLADYDAVDSLIDDPRVAGVTLTGSSHAGRSVARAAGDAIKPVVLELGGADPFIVLPSADVERAAATAIAARYGNNGQSCIAAKRFIVHADVHDRFVEQLAERAAALPVGDPMQESTALGPVISQAARAELHEQVEQAAQAGATIRLGGQVPDGPGWFYPATILTGITPRARLWREESFGPVASVITVGGVDEAIEVANATEFGLGAAGWTADAAEAERLVAELEAGTVTINGMTTSYPQLPFGGTKRSGVGRELAAEGLASFANIKTVWIGE